LSRKKNDAKTIPNSNESSDPKCQPEQAITRK